MEAKHVKPTARGMRILLYVASFLVLSVGFSLFFFSTRTDIYFSWTINPPLTAAFLGAGYLASFLTEFLSARERDWVRARVAVPGVWVFTTLTLIITLIHLDRFHFDSPAFITRAGTWVWLGVYISVPVAMGILWLRQMQQPGENPARKSTLPSWLRPILAGQGLIMLFLGVTMILFPNLTIPIWPWKLSVLTSQAIGAWGAGIGVIVLHANWENDWGRLYPMMSSYAVYGILQIVNLIRYPSVMDWSGLSAFLYAGFVVSIVVVGAYGTFKARKHIHKAK